MPIATRAYILEIYSHGTGIPRLANLLIWALLVSAVTGRRPGKALDFGMGQRRNSVLLALRGWDVTGFDPSGVAVRAAKASAPHRTQLAKRRVTLRNPKASNPSGSP